MKETKPVERRNILVEHILDLEAFSMDGFLMAGFYTVATKDYQCFWWWQEEELARFLLLEYSGDCWAHFGGGYDYKWLLDWAFKLKVQFSIEAATLSQLGVASDSAVKEKKRQAEAISASIITSGAGVVVIKTKHARFADSIRLVPMSLAKFTAGLGVSKQQLKFPCFKRMVAEMWPPHAVKFEITQVLKSPEALAYGFSILNNPARLARDTEKCSTDCPGFCWFSPDAPPEVLEAIKKYNYFDCASLAEALTGLQQFAAANDLDLGWTIGGAAWSELKRVYGVKPNRLPLYEHRFVRASYYGGRVQLLKHSRLPIVYQFDVNALYPSRLAQFEFPAGDPSWRIGRRAKEALLDNCQGAYEVEIDVPRGMYMPPLPIRYKKANSLGIAYPTGRLRGVWMGIEILNAIRLGCKLVSVFRGLVWPETTREFSSAVLKWWRLRANAPGGKSSGVGEWVKFRSNSPCGKFGAREEKRRYDLTIDDIRKCTCKTPEQRLRCKCRAHKKVSDYVYESTYSRVDDCARIEIASTITSLGRIAVLEACIASGVERTAYLDTDGIKLVELPESDSRFWGMVGGKMDLGKFLDEGQAYDWEGMAPKVYSGLAGAEGEVYIRTFLGKKASDEDVAKALTWTPRHFPPLTEEGVLLLDDRPIIKSKGGKLTARPTEGSTAERWSIRGIHSGAATGKFFKAVHLKRRFSRQYGDRVPTENGETRAPDVTEISPIDPLQFVKL